MRSVDGAAQLVRRHLGGGVLRGYASSSRLAAGPHSASSCPGHPGEQRAPHVAVIGAGLVGLTSAQSLVSRGFRVTVVDRQPHVANECSFANAALLMRSYSRPKTATVLQLLRWAVRRDEPVAVTLRAMTDPSMVSFGLRFLLSGPQTERRIFETTQTADAITEASIEHLDFLRAELGLQTPSVDGGLLMFFTDAAKLRALINEAEASFKPEDRASRYRVLNAAECIALEPSIRHREAELAGGVIWPHDKTICPLSFSQELAAWLEGSAVQLALGDEAVALRAGGESGGSLLELASGSSLPVDAVVVAAGVGSGRVLRALGGDAMPPVPLYGMRGHSLTLDVSHLPGSGEHGHLLQRSICDGDTMSFFSPLLPAPGSDRKLLRLAAFGDFDGWDYGPAAVRPWRKQQLLNAARTTFGPSLGLDGGHATAPPLGASALGPRLCPDDDPATQWCGLRPMSPDGLPIVGCAGSAASGCRVFINAGHGALGWTMSGGCAELLAEAVQAELPSGAPSARPAPAALRRLAPELNPARFRWAEVLSRAGRMRLGRSLAQAGPTPVS